LEDAMITVGVYEARTHWSELLDKVAKGEMVTITRRGVPVAVLESPNGVERAGVREAIERIKERGRGKSLDGITIRELIEDGRRY